MKNFLFLGIFLSLTGCVPLLIADALIPDQKTKKNKSSEERQVRRPLETTQEGSAHFYRRKQMVTKYDCNGHVVSRSLKTVKKHLDKTFTVDYEGRKNAWSITILNRRNGSKPVMPSRSEGQFTVDLSPTWNHIRVSEGFNEIEYVFYKCPDIATDASGQKSCRVNPVVEKEGIFLLDIKYDEPVIPGESEERPSPGSCPTT